MMQNGMKILPDDVFDIDFSNISKEVNQLVRNCKEQGWYLLYIDGFRLFLQEYGSR